MIVSRSDWSRRIHSGDARPSNFSVLYPTRTVPSWNPAPPTTGWKTVNSGSDPVHAVTPPTRSSAFPPSNPTSISPPRLSSDPSPKTS
jgi:hypothetical protein